MKEKNKLVGVWMDTDMVAALKTASENLGCSQSDLVRLSVVFGLAKAERTIADLKKSKLHLFRAPRSPLRAFPNPCLVRVPSVAKK